MMNESIRTWLMRVWLAVGGGFVFYGLYRQWVNPQEFTFIWWGCGILVVMTIVGLVDVFRSKRQTGDSCENCACKTSEGK